MSIFNYKKVFNTFYLIIIIIFSFAINWKYSKYGIFPIDSFLHYDSAFRILNDEYPIKDYWVISGIFVDFIQAGFFKILNPSWNAYILHSSILNVLISVLTFYFLIKINLSNISAFFYSICISILAYPVSGTPFVDLHASFFCLITTYFIFNAIKEPEKNLNWFLIVSFCFFAFFSKIVPSVYFILLNSLIISGYLISRKKLKVFIPILLFTLFYLILFYLIFKILDINFKSFYIQYIDYPISIGSNRLNIFNFSFTGFISNFKFILIPLLILFFFKIIRIVKKKITFFSIEFINFVIFFNLCFSLLLHQILTKNQIFIFFLIPVCLALLQVEVKKLNLNNEKKINYLFLILMIFLTYKYHVRFNENRKFHELVNVDISSHVETISLDKSLKGILWITPNYQGYPREEIEMLKSVKLILNEKKNIMLLTHYLFLDSITKTKLNSPSRTHTTDGASIPMAGNKYFLYYKNFLYEKLLKEKIYEVYFIKSENLSVGVFTQFFEKNCYSKEESDLFIIFKLDKNCLH